MRTINESDYSLVLDILREYAVSAVERTDIRGLNRRRRVRLLLRRMERSRNIDYSLIKQCLRR